MAKVTKGDQGGEKKEDLPLEPHANQGLVQPMQGLKPQSIQTHNPTGAGNSDQNGNKESGKPKTVEGKEPGSNHNRPADKHVSETVENYKAYVAELKEAGEFDFKVEASAKEFTGLFEGTDINEEVVSKMTTVFEAAVREAAKAHVSSILEKFEGIVEEVIDVHEETTNESVDAYLDYVVTEWMEENKLAVQSGLRSEITESFMHGLKELLESHYIDVPESKVDLVESMNATIDELTEKLDEQIEKNVTLAEEVKSKQKALVVEGLVAGLTIADAEKVRSLAEDVEFSDEETFTSKMNTLKEAFIAEAAPVAVSNVDGVVRDQNVLNEGEQIPAAPKGDPLVAGFAKYISSRA